MIDDATFEVRVNEPDVPEATRFEDINFDGDELILARNAGAIGPYDEALLGTDFAGTGDGEFSNLDRRLRLSARSVWHSRRGSSRPAVLVVPLLEEVRKTASSAAKTGDLPEHARVVELRLPDRRGIQLFGSRSAVGSIPQTGTAVFAGEIFGNWLNDSNQLSEFVGDAVLSVDFALGTVTGEISISQYLGQTVAIPPIEIRFNATISGETFVAQQVTVTGPQVIQGGTLRGAFFGPVADEIGLVLSTSGATGSIMAGLVAGKE